MVWLAISFRPRRVGKNSTQTKTMTKLIGLDVSRSTVIVENDRMAPKAADTAAKMIRFLQRATA